MSLLEAIRQARLTAGFRTDAVAPAAARDEPVLHTLFGVVACGLVYSLTTQLAWLLTFPDSKVSLFFPPHAVMVAILLLVPTRHWWAYALVAATGHFLATQQAGWPPLYALQCEAFDAAKYLLTAAAIRRFVAWPVQRITLRDAIVFVLIAVVVVPFATAFWGAAFTVANHYGADYWIEWRNLGVSNGVTAIVLVPAILLGVHAVRAPRARPDPWRAAEAALLGASLVAVGYFAFVRLPAGPDSSPALLYAPVPLLIWAALRFGLGGISGSMVVITLLAISGTMLGRGPFQAQSPEENVLELQLFLLFVATPLMLLTAVIAEERHAKEALRISEERMGLAAEAAQLVLWDWDLDNDRVWLPAEGRRFFGIADDEIIDHRTLAERVHPDDRELRTAAIERALATGNAYECEFRIVQPDGSLRWIAARGAAARRDGAGTPRRIRGVAIDVTRQKLAGVEAQVQRDELAHLSRVATLSLLSGSLAHELSQPLSSILSNAQAGQRHMSAASPDLAEIREILADIVGEDRRAGEIIGRLRTMLRRGEVSRQPVYVGECLEELLRLTHSDLIGRRITVVNLATGELPPVLADRVQLQQVLLNLIVNACDAMEANPADQRKLTLTAAVVRDELQVGVLDLGVGLPDDVEALFQPLYTTKDQGLGMGLSICRALVAAHGGRLWAERRPGRGAAFRLALPLAVEDVR